MAPIIPPDVQFIVDPDIAPRSLAPEQRRALQDDYEPERGYGVFPWEIAEEGGPDRSAYLMGARWEGVTHMASQEDDMREGYFVSRRTKGPWRWILWRCSWDDDGSTWWWSSAGATTWRTRDGAAAGREMVTRLWKNWREHPAPDEIDATGLLYPDDIWALVAEGFGGPQKAPGEETGVQTDANLGVPQGASEATSEPTEQPVGMSQAEMLATTSDADLARLLGIRYRDRDRQE